MWPGYSVLPSFSCCRKCARTLESDVVSGRTGRVDACGGNSRPLSREIAVIRSVGLLTRGEALASASQPRMPDSRRSAVTHSAPPRQYVLVTYRSHRAHLTRDPSRANLQSDAPEDDMLCHYSPCAYQRSVSYGGSSYSQVGGRYTLLLLLNSEPPRCCERVLVIGRGIKDAFDCFENDCPCLYALAM